jgi:hypothetical protein
MVMAEASSSDQQAQSEENADKQSGAESGDGANTEKVDQPPGAHPGKEN